jgi:anti-sigma factor RsiW
MSAHENNRTTQSEHDGVWELLPWYANATLHKQDASRVEKHLASCPDCRAELERCRRLALAAKAVEVPEWSPSPVHFANLMAQIDRADGIRGAATGTPRALAASEPAPWSRVREWLFGARGPTWVYALQAALILVLGGAILFSTMQPQPAYQTASRPETQVTENRARVHIALADDITNKEFRELLQRVGGEIVSGPSATGVYTIALPFPPARQDSTEQALVTLRANPKVRLAEPVDGGGRP